MYEDNLVDKVWGDVRFVLFLEFLRVYELWYVGVDVVMKFINLCKELVNVGVLVIIIIMFDEVVWLLNVVCIVIEVLDL